MRALRRLVRLRRQDEVVLAQAAHGVGPEGHLHPSPGQEDVGVVPLALGDLAQAVDEVEGFAEVLEAVFLLQVMLVGHRPAELELAEELAQLFPLQGAPFGRLAGLFQQIAHPFTSTLPALFWEMTATSMPRTAGT